MENLGGFSGRAAILAESMTYGGSPDAYLDQLQIMTAATPQQVGATSRRWLDAHHYTLTVIPFPELGAGEEAVDRSVVPELGPDPEVRFPEVQRSTLANGLDVLLLERHGAPMVNMTLAVDAGYAADPAGAPGTAALALEQMTEGTTSRTGFEIVDELDALGAEISTGSSLDMSFVRLRALSFDLGGALDVFADVVLNPSFPQEMTELGKRRRVARIGQEKAQPISMAFRVVPGLLYGEGHPYANPLTGSGHVETIEALSRKELAAWHRTWFHPGNATLIVTGDITLEALVPLLERAFGSWSTGAAPVKKVTEVTAPPGGRVYLIDKPDAEQSLVVAAHVSVPGGRPYDLAIETAMRAFGGMSTSRLMRNLRLDKHWTYGAYGLLFDARGQRPFIALTSVQADKTKETMEELTSEINGIAGQRPLQGEEFATIKRNMVLRLPGRFDTLRSLESAAEDLVNYGYPPAYYYDYAENVRRLTEGDLNAAAAECVRPDRLTWVVVGDVAAIEDGIRGLGYGDIVRLDADGRPLQP
jgi:zinc protease